MLYLLEFCVADLTVCITPDLVYVLCELTVDFVATRTPQPRANRLPDLVCIPAKARHGLSSWVAQQFD
jgi:hypothetical protein